MNLYFLVEGMQSERKVYPAWLSHLLPELTQVHSYDEVKEKNYYLISGEGYPSLYDFIGPSVEEINLSGKYNYFVVCLDAEENTVAERHAEIYNFLARQKLVLKNTEFVLIVQNRCLETWLLGNRKIYSKQPQNQPLLDYTKYYDVSVDCPETMGKYREFNTHAQFHGAYLKALFEAKNTTYSKKRPADVLKSFYLENLLKRIEEKPQQLTTFRHFVNFCKIVQSKL
ncbi:hypothetical protein [Microcoleus sp. bin38.metabat.b11b12b14.051]|uniref:hypothetical protein n=1 Tax=Microcoleus sp. bin38.metabat.b11b12b14.051 TaxID=2742709 RepID=UPI0025DDF871|nr:hypothetical protein [Microcoleus sp. bin38.metabat.b11b12b14.051]